MTVACCLAQAIEKQGYKKPSPNLKFPSLKAGTMLSAHVELPLSPSLLSCLCNMQSLFVPPAGH